MQQASVKRNLFLIGISILVLIFIGIGVRSFFIRKPVIETILPISAGTGDTITIYGSNFGQLSGDARVEFNGIPVQRTAYLEWKDNSIRLTVPLLDKTPIIKVRTSSGYYSNGKIIACKDKLPGFPNENSEQAVGPVIVSIDVKDAVTGGLLIIKGYNFGINRGTSEVIFTAQTVASAIDGTGLSESIVADSDEDYTSWSDKEIQMRIPDGAVSGPIWVKTLQGQSKPQFLQLQNIAKKRFITKRTYALESFTSISKIKAKPGGLLYIWRKMPVSTDTQRNIKLLESSTQPLYADNQVTCFLIQNPETVVEYTIVQRYLVQSISYTVEVNPDEIQIPKTGLPSLYTKYTASSDLVPADDASIQDFARNSVQNEKNPYRRALLVLNALRKTYTVQSKKGDTPVAALRAKSGSVRALALLYTAALRSLGIPARPVAGIIIDDNKKAHEHYWCEFFIYGVGWVPVDPALYMNALTFELTNPFSSTDKYFGSLDDRHIAFSLDSYKVSRLLPDGKTSRSEKEWSFIDINEEYSHEIQSYTSFWSDIEVTGIY
ncbi:MAG TPA: transglutaminase domain-containing protein [Spirochaetia bacterium]|nr:transglutaminase domain-containing protein [Spirochaetales bacterium]HPD80377.1 transglutaminase domain-containing protein [Spirochaetales bacterium]HQK33417.1 transglutaminase domain-containing protein [Spirochaetales bacterium]HRS64855.1 transglutaminase domain-containing protein [Spirochaetia bacterium]HRV28509.1 transglutaminase domain-containing protein [Spirochaetia bacterium]